MAPANADREQTVLITGCSRGFGGVIARTLAEEGHRVFASMRESEGRNAPAKAALKEWAEAGGLDLRVIELDVADDDSVGRAVDSILDSGMEIDILVNNASIFARGPIEAYTGEQVQHIFNVNSFGQLRVARAVLPHMRSRRSGLIVNITSTTGRFLPGRGGLYQSSKWGAEGLSESLAYDIKPFGIDLVILEPGAFPTEALARGIRAAREDVVADYSALGRATPAPSREEPSDYSLPDLQEIADEVSRLIRLPAGSRPLRTVVGPLFTEGVGEYNALYERMRDHLRKVLQRPDQAVPMAMINR